jgi:hypothetical protein
MANHVRLFDPERLQEPQTVGSLFADAQRPIGVGTAHESAAVVADQLITVGQRRLAEQWPERVRDGGSVDEEDWLANPYNAGLQHDAIHMYSLKRAAFLCV